MNQSVKKAFEILSYVVENPTRLSLNRMADALGMNKTTLFRFLSTLESIDILAKRGDIYVPGMKLFQLGSKVPVKQLIVDKTHPVLRRLTADVNETVNMGQLSSNRVLYLDKVESSRSLQIHTRIGGFAELHSSALGKCILSILPEPLRAATIGSLTFEARTRRTITDQTVLRQHIDNVLNDGYATDREELEEGLHCVAVPLLIEPFGFYGAMSFSGPSTRFTEELMAQLAAKLNQTVKEIKQMFE